MADYITARNDRERMAAIKAQLTRAVRLFPREILPDQQRECASALVETATTHVHTAPASELRAAEDAPARRAALLARLKPRGAAVTASIQLLKVLAPPLARWQRQIEQRVEVFLEQEDELQARGQLQPQLDRLSAFAEAMRALDACVMALEGRLYAPYRQAMLILHDNAIMDEDVPELDTMLKLYETIQWGTEKNIRHIGNPLAGLEEFPDRLVSDCGLTASLDYQLLGLVWADAMVQHTLLGLSANSPDRDAFSLQMGRSMLERVEFLVCPAISPSYPTRARISVPAVQRGVWLVLGSLQQLCAWCDVTMQAACQLVLRSVKHELESCRMTLLQPQYAPVAAVAFLAGSALMPRPPPRLALAPAPAPARMAAAAAPVAPAAAVLPSAAAAARQAPQREAPPPAAAVSATAPPTPPSSQQPLPQQAAPPAPGPAAAARPQAPAPPAAAQPGAGTTQAAAPAAPAATPYGSVSSQFSEEAEEESEEEGEEEADSLARAAAAAGPSQLAASAAAAAAPAAKKKKKKKKKKKSKGCSAAPDQVGPAAAPAAAAPTPAAAAAPPLPADASAAPAADETPMDRLLAALEREAPECMVCLDELCARPSSTSFLSCNVYSDQGPFHAMCNPCWLGLETAECPMRCGGDVHALSPQQFLDALAAKDRSGGGRR